MINHAYLNFMEKIYFFILTFQIQNNLQILKIKDQ